MSIKHDILERRSKLSPNKRLLLEKRLSGGVEGNSKSHVPRFSKQGLRPPSFGQQRLWFVDQLEPNSAVYNRPAAVRLRGPLNVTALDRGLHEILARHEALRTTFSNVRGQLGQIISPPAPSHLPVLDLGGLAKPEQETQALRWVNEEARRPFDLVQGPLQRMTLVRLGEHDHILVLVIHHMVFDGWSLGVLFRELALLYESFSEGKPSPLQELPIQYADFAAWQRNYLQGEALETQLAYWKRQLGGNLAVLQLPTDRPRPAIQTYHSGRHSLVLSKALTGALKALSKSEEVTVFMTLLTAFQTLLYRYTNQEDILVGSPIAGRNRSETEGLIGFFVNTLVMRADLSGNPSFRQLLGRIRKIAVEAYAHQDVPFEKLVEVLRPERALGHMPLYQVMFQLRNIPRRELNLSGVEVEDFEFDRVTERLDLSLEMVEKAEKLVCLFEYNRELFDAATISRMAGHFQTLLDSIVTDPGQTILGLSLLTEAEREQLLVEWNNTERGYPREQTIHQLFEVQVERTPDAVAVVFNDLQLTYRQLNERANQLARYLRNLGVGPEVLVGISMERSLEIVIGLLGILKAGGAYVPLDPDYPPERYSFMLEDSSVPVLITQQRLVETLPESGAQIICLDRDWPLIADNSVENPDTAISSGNLCYVIYTSGSTGRPKGAMNIHRGLCNRLVWMQQTYQLTSSDRVLQKTPFSFDVSVWEFFWPLITGAGVVIAEPGGHKDSVYLVRLINEQNVTTLHFVPSMLRAFLDEPAASDCPSLKRVICSGEALPIDLQERFFERHNVELHNLYGPTEASIDVTSWTCEPNSELPVVPIGRPIANTRIYIVDGRLQPVPVGVPGELYIGGEGLARGYLNRPGLTSEKFIANPFSDDSTARLYRTGDLARYLADGNLEFLGRIDHQVKIRGNRIELGEIETVLNEHPGISESVVVAREEGPGDQRLVAYLVTSYDATSPGELRAFLKAKLPEYMVPSIFTSLQAMPLTPNGKVDRTALPAPDWTSLELEENYVAAGSYPEAAVANIWRKVLGVARIGVEDNFFSLGGHSLLAMQVLSTIRHRFQIEVPLRIMFENPTIASLAEVIRRSVDAGDSPASQPILPASRNEHAPLSFAQQRLWFLDQSQSESPFHNFTLVRHFNGSLNVAVLEKSLNEIVRRHESLRTAFTTLENEPVQVVSPALPVCLTVIDLRQIPGGERDAKARRLAADEAQRPFDLSRGPLFRAALLRLSDATNIVLLTMHHIISDGWSLEVLQRELNVLYEAFSNGLPSPLPELPIQYADYAAWQRSWLQGEVLARELVYWRDQLRDAPALLNLPTDKPRPAVQTFRGARHYFELSSTLAESLHLLSQRQSSTLFVTLLAAFQVLLSRYTRRDDLVVGSVIAGRWCAEIEGLIGFFANTLVLRSDLSGDPTFRELLSRVKAVTLGAYEHQDLPFDMLVEALQPIRDAGYTPLIQVMFVLQNTSVLTETPAVGRREISSFSLEIETRAKDDLTLLMTETERGLIGEFEYSTDLFFPETIARMAGHLQTLLESIVGDAEQRISRLRMLTEAESDQLMFSNA